MENFVSYDKQTKEYMIYLYYLQKVIVSRNIIFEESKFLNLKKTTHSNEPNNLL